MFLIFIHFDIGFDSMSKLHFVRMLHATEALKLRKEDPAILALMKEIAEDGSHTQGEADKVVRQVRKYVHNFEKDEL